MVTIEIDGRLIEAREGAFLLDAALDSGVYIPNLCHHPALKPAGACGLCVVEIEGENGTSRACTTVVYGGMKVRTDTEHIRKLRRVAAELVMAEHPEECNGCPKYGNCTLQSVDQYLGTNNARFRNESKAKPVNRENPLFVLDPMRCIKCGRCVRICREIRGVKVIDYRKDENGDTYIGAGTDLLADSGCRFCGSCVEVCPTGALRDKDEIFRGIGEDGKNETLVPCRTACPAKIDIPKYLRAIAQGNYESACSTILERAPFPLTLGFICSRPCEPACRRGQVNEAISIRALKRYAFESGDDPREKAHILPPPKDKRVAVVGSGPAGLTAASCLAETGYDVTVFEKLPQPGGMLRYGIPEYRLPVKILEKEIGYLSQNVKINSGTAIASAEELFNSGFSAVLLAVGAHTGTRLPIPGSNLPGVLLNIDFLRSVRMGNTPELGTRVVVLGGGEVAFDCAQTAARLGAKEVHVVCLESREKMTASDETIAEASEEGVTVYPAHSFLRICGESKAEGVKIAEVESFTFDENRRAVITLAEGTEKILEADTVIFAVGQRPENPSNFGVSLIKNSYFEVDGNMATDKLGVFAAGDAVTGTKSVAAAIGGGRIAAEQIDRYLGGNGLAKSPYTDEEIKTDDYIGRIEGFAEKERCKTKLLPIERRLSGEGPLECPLEAAAACEEAHRCLQCDLRLRIPTGKLWVDFLPAKTEGGE